MSGKQFAELCRSAAGMLDVLAKQADSESGEVIFNLPSVSETSAPLLQLLTVIVGSAK